MKLSRLGIVGGDGERAIIEPRIYAIEGQQTGIWFDTKLATSAPSSAYRFEVTGGLGVSDADKWLWTPPVGAAGDHPITFVVRDGTGKMLGRAQTIVQVSDNAPPVGAVNLIFAGDSVSAASLYPNQIAARLTAAGVAWTMLGTVVPGGASPGVRTEGHSGFTYTAFATDVTSPLVTAGVINIPAYEAAVGVPDIVFFLLGPNENSATPENNPDPFIRADCEYGDAILTKWRIANPNALFVMCTVLPCSANPADFQFSLPRSRYMKSRARINEFWMARWLRREAAGVFLGPVSSYLDTTLGFTANNVHPNALGSVQLADAMYARLRTVL